MIVIFHLLLFALIAFKSSLKPHDDRITRREEQILHEVAENDNFMDNSKLASELKRIKNEKQGRKTRHKRA